LLPVDRRGRPPDHRRVRPGDAAPGADRLRGLGLERRQRRQAARTMTVLETTDHRHLELMINGAWERRRTLTLDEIDGSTRPAVERVIAGLESGEFRVAVPGNGSWQVNQWIKKAVLLYFRVSEMTLMDGRPAPYWDKVPARFAGFDEIAF